MDPGVWRGAPECAGSPGRAPRLRQEPRALDRRRRSAPGDGSRQPRRLAGCVELFPADRDVFTEEHGVARGQEGGKEFLPFEEWHLPHIPFLIADEVVQIERNRN